MPWCIKIIFVIVILLHTEVWSKTNPSYVKNCYEGGHCTHDYHQKCGVNKKGEFKRFWDTCSMKKYNCDHKEDFIITNMNSCKHVPNLKKHLLQPWERTLPNWVSTKIVMSTVVRTKSRLYDKTYWCKMADNCKDDNQTRSEVCGKDHRLKAFRVFVCECTMADFNCGFSMNYTKTNHTIEKCWHIIDERTHLGGKQSAASTVEPKFIAKKAVTPKVLRIGFDVDLAFMGQNQMEKPQLKFEEKTPSLIDPAELSWATPRLDTNRHSKKLKGSLRENFLGKNPYLDPEFGLKAKYQIQNPKELPSESGRLNVNQKQPQSDKSDSDSSQISDKHFIPSLKIIGKVIKTKQSEESFEWNPQNKPDNIQSGFNESESDERPSKTEKRTISVFQLNPPAESDNVESEYQQSESNQPSGSESKQSESKELLTDDEEGLLIQNHPAD